MKIINSLKYRIQKILNRTAVFAAFLFSISLATIPNYAGTVNFTYYELGRVISVTQDNRNTVGNQYDVAGNWLLLLLA